MVLDDLESGRLAETELEGPAAGIMPFQAVCLDRTVPSPAGRWLTMCLTDN